MAAATLLFEYDIRLDQGDPGRGGGMVEWKREGRGREGKYQLWVFRIGGGLWLCLNGESDRRKRNAKDRNNMQC